MEATKVSDHSVGTVDVYVHSILIYLNKNILYDPVAQLVEQRTFDRFG